MSTNVCADCELPQPLAHLMFRGEKVKQCRTCRVREQARARSKLRHSKTTLHARFAGRSLRSRELFDAALYATRLKRLKSRFNHETANTRTRLRIMTAIVGKCPRTIKAIKARQKILDRYIEAYEAQVLMLKAGVNPPDIVDIVEG